MKKSLALASCLFFVCLVSAQKTLTVSLYYNINEVKSENNFRRVDSLLTSVESGTTELSIIGYADYLHITSYNLILSQKRAEAIKKYILQTKQEKNISILKCEGLGEKNSTEKTDKEGEPSQRRVDLIVTQYRAVKKIGTRDNIIQQQTPKVKEPERDVKPKSNSGNKNLEDLEKGETMAIQGLNFIPGRHILVRTAMPILEELLETLKEHSELKIEIQGHICCLDPEEEDGLDFDTNERNLSEGRAKTVYNYLVRNGISQDRLIYKGYGHKYPKVEPERSPADEQVNRRVEIKILEN